MKTTDYKRTEIGTIANDWKLVMLKDLCVKDGLVRGPFGGALKKESFVREGVKVYEQKNAINSDVSIGTYYINLEKYRELNRFEVFYKDFIVSCSGTIGRIFQIPRNAPKGIINQALLKIRTNDDIVDDKFFLHYFKWNEFQERIIDTTQGGAMKNLVGMPIFKTSLFPLPPTKAEQAAIATALSDADALIQSLEKLIAKKQAIKQGTMQALLTGKKRLPGFSGEWEWKKLGETSMLKARIGWQGLTTNEYLKDGHYYLITGTDFNNGKIEWSRCFHVEYARYVQDKNIQVKENDVLVTKDGTIGKVAFIKDVLKPATLNSGVFVIRPRNNSYYPHFFYYLLMSSYFEIFLKQLSASSTISHLYQKDFVHFEFPLPSTLQEQTAIAQVLGDMDAEIEALEQRLAKFRQIKQGMMQELLTGKTRLL